MNFTQEEINLAVNNISKDENDDFWPDIINYRDYINNPSIFYEIDFNNYFPHSLLVLDIPKPNLILRPGHFISILDRVYFQLILNKFSKEIDEQLVSDQISFGYRVSNKRNYFLNKNENIQNWKKFIKKSDNNFINNPNGFLLKTDINAFFEHIKVKKIIEILKYLEVEKEILDKLSSLLNTWCEDEIGLCQGNDCSSFLANVYLYEVDQSMIESGFNYYRFVDDIRVFSEDEVGIRKALSKLTELLRPLNLHLNGGKTEVVNSIKYLSNKNNHSDTMDIVNYFISDIDDVGCDFIEDQLKEMWDDAVIRKKVDKINKTVLKFCIYKFKRIHSAYPLESILENNLFDPCYSREICCYLEDYLDRFEVQQLLINIFNSTPYLFQKIFIIRTLLKAGDIFSELMLSLDKEKIYGTSNFMLIGYYLVFTAKFGSYGSKMSIKNDFYRLFSNEEKIARYFLVAIKNLPDFEKNSNKLLRTFPALKNTYVFLKSIPNGLAALLR